MKRKITGDKDFHDLVVAHLAIDAHVNAHGTGNQGHNVVHKVSYRGKVKCVEVTTRKSQYTARVLTGAKRELSKLGF